MDPGNYRIKKVTVNLEPVVTTNYQVVKDKSEICRRQRRSSSAENISNSERVIDTEKKCMSGATGPKLPLRTRIDNEANISKKVKDILDSKIKGNNCF